MLCNLVGQSLRLSHRGSLLRRATRCWLSTKEPNVIPGAHQHYGSLQDDLPRTSSQPEAWQAADNFQVQDVTQKALIYDLIHQQTQTLERTVPWFLRNMPASYFRQVPDKFRKDHIKAIAAVKDANMDLYLNLQSSHLSDGRQVLTYVRPGTKPGTLLQMVQELPQNDLTLSRIHVFSTADETMSLNMFIYGMKEQKLTAERVQEIGGGLVHYAETVQKGLCAELEPNELFELDKLIPHMLKCTETYLKIGNDDPVRFLRHILLVNVVASTEGTAVHSTNAGDGTYWIDMAVANSLPQVALDNLCKLLYIHNFDVHRARLDNIPVDDTSVTLLRALAMPMENTKTVEERLTLLQTELKRTKWLDTSTQELVFEKFPDLGVTRAEVITGLCGVLHPVLAKTNNIAFSTTNIHMTVIRFMVFAKAIADLFLDRFRPGTHLSDAEFEERCEALSKKIDEDVEDRTASTILHKMIHVTKCTLKTNAFMPDRYALSFRLDPACMASEGEDRELPYGVVFVHGRRFNGFHVRFRDIARGGMRLVTPASAEQYALESVRQYDECYGLAYAQQLKNKDIPEGGSKAVNLINTHGLSEKAKQYVMRKSVKAMTDAMLDLIVDTDYTRKYLVDRWGKTEVLYLGPDEQVLPEDIEWIVKRAAYRGYGTPNAFMSSKPRVGINHKEYGVTSEGVNVYLDVALRKVLNIDPTKDSFSVKMTGGPDGDVAGNEIKILFREYDQVKIVGIADHSGCAEDPEGLDRDELLRLVNESLCISNFDESKLGSDGVLHTVDTTEGVKARNTMHNRLEADAFLPCGGRPNTIDMNNYRQFLREDGSPSAPLIVEGANLFITADARKALFEDANVAIIKDSSANKGGVITSSYEICAAMLLSEDEFFNNKEQIVGEVLDKLRTQAKMEAVLLFREHENYYDGSSLPEVSQIISECINTTTDALSAALDNLSLHDREALLPLFSSHLPLSMADMACDHLTESVPEQYIKNAIASCLASKLVYKEGTKFITSQSRTKLADIALQYVKKEGEVALLMDSIENSDMNEEEKERVLTLLEHGGARTALQIA